MATPAVVNPRPKLQRSSRAAVLAAACCGVFVSFASVVVYTFGVFLKPLASSFHWSRTQVSLAFTLAALTVAVCSPFIGRLLDRFPARRVVLPCTVVYAAAVGSLAFLTPHLWHLYAVFIVLGIVGNGTTQLGYARVVSAWFDKQRGRALAAVMAGSGLGSMVFPSLAQALISGYGWRIAYALLGALILVIGVPLATLFLYEPTETLAPAQEAAKQKSSDGLWSLPFLGIALALLLFSFATNGLNAHWAALLTDGGRRTGCTGCAGSLGCRARYIGQQIVYRLSAGSFSRWARRGRTGRPLRTWLCPHSCWPRPMAFGCECHSGRSRDGRGVRCRPLSADALFRVEAL